LPAFADRITVLIYNARTLCCGGSPTLKQALTQTKSATLLLTIQGKLIAMCSRYRNTENLFAMTPIDHRLPLVIEPAELLDQLNSVNLLIIDLSKEQSYLQAHVPGAVFLPFKSLVLGTPPAPGLLPSKESLQQLFSNLGLTPDTHVVAYDDEGGGWAGRLIWTLDVIGHQRYSYLNGGILAWLAQKLPTESKPVTSKTSHVQITLHPQPCADKDYLLGRLGAADLAIWDARSPGEFNGEKKFSARAGHIPGAANYEWTRGMDKARQLQIRDLETIRSELARIGITHDKEIITHCQTHHRSGFTYLLGKVLGFKKIRAYPGSWAEWGNDPSMPVESATL